MFFYITGVKVEAFNGAAAIDPIMWGYNVIVFSTFVLTAVQIAYVTKFQICIGKFKSLNPHYQHGICRLFLRRN